MSAIDLIDWTQLRRGRKVGLSDMTIKVEIKEIKGMLDELNRKIDALARDRETLVMMMMSQHSLKDFFAHEPDLYSIKDIRTRYK